jgi:hypothetical protein
MSDTIVAYAFSFALVILSSGGAFYLVCLGQAKIAKYTQIAKTERAK